MVKQIAGIIATILVLTAIMGCAQTNDKKADITSSESEETTAEKTYAIMDAIPMSFTEVLQGVDCTAVGKFISYENKNDHAEYTFEVTEVWYGEIQESTIRVFSAIGSASAGISSYELGKDIYTGGEEYVLILTESTSPSYEHTQYYVPAGIYIPANDTSKSMMQGKPLEDVAGLNVSAVKSLIQNILSHQ